MVLMMVMIMVMVMVIVVVMVMLMLMMLLMMMTMMMTMMMVTVRPVYICIISSGPCLGKRVLHFGVDLSLNFCCGSWPTISPSVKNSYA